MKLEHVRSQTLPHTSFECSLSVHTSVSQKLFEEQIFLLSENFTSLVVITILTSLDTQTNQCVVDR